MTIDFEPFSAEKLDALRRAQELEEHFRTYDQAPHITDAPSRELVRAGCLLTMAIWYGALLDPHLWSPWLRAIATELHEDPHGLWVELAPSDSPCPTRWFADPVTEVLLRRTQPQHQSIADTLDPRRCISAYLGHLEVPSADERAREIERLSESRWRLRMPAILVEVARGSIYWRPVSSENWKRTVSAGTEYSGSDIRNSYSAASRQGQLGCKFSTEQTPKFQTSPNERQRRKTNSGPQAADDFPIAKALENGAIKKNGRLQWHGKSDSRSQCLDDVKLVAAAGDKSALRQVLNEWVVARIDTNPALGRPRVKNVSPQHVRRQLNHLIPIVRKLESVAAPDWLNLTSEQLAAEYRLAIRGSSSMHERRAIRNAVVSFQDFLEVYRTDICVLFHEYDDINEGEDNVRSILVPPAAYMGALHNLTGSSRDKRMQRVMLILGYRAGLRVLEAEALLVSNFITTSNKLELRIFANKHFTLKTRAARRRIPLHALIPPEELAEVEAWLLQRRRETAGLVEHALMFCKLNEPFKKLSRKQLVRPIENALRELCGNPDLVYHQLRHSFASYALACMLLPPDTPDDFCPSGFDEWTISGWRRKELIAALAGATAAGQFAGDAVGTVLGHRTNEMTYKWYIHMLDWSLGQYVRRPAQLPGYTASALSGYTGLSEATILRRTTSAASKASTGGLPLRRKQGRRRRDTYDPGSARLELFLPGLRRKFPLGQRHDPPVLQIPPPAITQFAPIKSDWRALTGVMTSIDKGLPLDEVAARFGSTVEECLELSQNADLISWIVTRGGRRRFRYSRWIDASPAEQGPRINGRGRSIPHWVPASKKDRLQIPGLPFLHRDTKRFRAGSKNYPPTEQDLADQNKRKRQWSKAMKDVARIDEMWPTFYRRQAHPWTKWLIKTFLSRYNERTRSIRLLSRREASWYVRSLLYLGISSDWVRVRWTAYEPWKRLPGLDSWKRYDGLSPIKRALDRAVPPSRKEIEVTVVRSETPDDDVPRVKSPQGRTPQHGEMIRGKERTCPTLPFLLLLLATVTNGGQSLGKNQRRRAKERYSS